MEYLEKQWKKNEQVMQPVTVVLVNFQPDSVVEAARPAEVAPTAAAVG